MIFLRHSLVLSTFILSALSSPTLPEQRKQQQEPHNPSRGSPQEEFQRLLAEIDESSIHAALHRWSSKFQDGVFNRDRTALEAIHAENAPVATSLIRLAKRQDNTTISTSASPDPPPTTTSPDDDTPSTTPEPDSPSTSNTSPAPPPATSNGVIQPVTTRTTATRAPTTQAVAVSTPPSATPIATTSGRVVFSVSNSQLTTVEASEEVVSFTPASSTVLSTFTLPDGQLSTQTSVTVVDAPVTGGGVGAPAATGAGAGNPGLQQGIASATRSVWKEVVAVVGGAVVMGLAM